MGIHSRWRRRLSGGREVLAAVFRELRAENVTFLAGSIAYHAFVSLLPFMLVVLLLVSRIEDQSTGVEVIAAMSDYLSPNANELVTSTVREATEHTSLSAHCLGVLLWGAIQNFRSLDEAFSSIYDVTGTKSFLDSFRDAIVALLAVGLGIGVAGIIGSVVSFDGGGQVAGALDTVVATFSLAVVFLPLFYLFPDEDVTVREVVPGTLLAAAGWTVLEFLFRYYVAVASVGERYGVLGTILLLVTWLYFSGFVLLLGAAVNAVLAGRSADASEAGWGENRNAKERAPFTEPLRRIDDGLAGGKPFSVSIDGSTVDLPTPDEYETQVSAPDRPESLGGEEVEGRLVLRWVYGRSVAEGKSEEREVPSHGRE
jgi:membrane protein